MANHLAISPSDRAILLISVAAHTGGSVQESLGVSEVVVPDGTAAEQAAYVGSLSIGVAEAELAAVLLVLEERRHPEVKKAADDQAAADAALATATSDLNAAQTTGDKATIDKAQATYDEALADKTAADKAFADADAAAKAADLAKPPTPPAPVAETLAEEATEEAAETEPPSAVL
jgi:hypothetical protein